MSLSYLYNLLLSQPLLNALVVLYNFLGHDIGLAIIALTLIIRLLLYPSFKHQLQSQKKLADIQPKMKEIKERFKNDREQQNRALMELYKGNKINPFSSCLPTIIQLFILIALYRVFLIGLNGQTLNDLYPFVKSPGTISNISFGFFNLSQPNLYLALITGAAQFIQSKMLTAFQPKKAAAGDKEDMSMIMSKQMMYILPVFTVIIGMRLPAGLAVYWLITTLFSIAQQYAIMRSKPKQIEGGQVS